MFTNFHKYLHILFIYVVSKKEGVYALLRCEILGWVAFLAVARGPTMSLSCPTRARIDKRVTDEIRLNKAIR